MVEQHKIKAIVGAIVIVLLVAAISITIALTIKNKPKEDEYVKRAKAFLDKNILIDGHNDFLTNIRLNYQNQLSKHRLYDLSHLSVSYTDITRLRKGKVGGQYWGLSLNCSTSGKDALLTHLEQADLLRRMIKKYPDVFQFATTVKEIREAFKNKKIASIMTLEGGHAIDSSIAILRIYHELGVRSMTLALNCITPWVDDHTVNANRKTDRGLTEFGKKIVKEMNRLGMVIDISHVSKKTMKDVLEISQTPVIFSHSCVYKICNSTRNVQDDVLELLKEKNGIIMIDFYNGFVNCNENYATIENVTAHINYIKDKLGVQHIGLGGDYDVLTKKGITPKGLEDVSKYPNLIALLMKAGWNDNELKLLAGENLLRVMEANEKYAESVKNELPVEDVIDKNEVIQSGLGNCRSFM